MTVIADMKSHRAEVVTGDRVNFGLHGDMLVAYAAAEEYGTIWLICCIMYWKGEHMIYLFSY